MDIIIKKLTENFLAENISQFIDILKEEPYEYWSEKNFLVELPGKFDLSYYAVFNEKVAGYIIASLKNDYVYIHKFLVDHRYRSHRIGAMLQKLLEKNIVMLNFDVIQLSVISDNKRAINFYKKNGFVAIATRFDRVNKIELAVMRKILL